MKRLMLSVAALAAAAGPAASQMPARPHWIATWSPSASWVAARPPAGQRDPVPTLVDRTLRQVVHTTLGGDSVRIRISNEYGDRPLIVGAATVALRAAGAEAQPGSAKPLTFGRRAGVTIGAGASVISDPVAYRVPQLADLLVSLYLPDSARTSTRHLLGLQTNYLSGPGNFADRAAFPVDSAFQEWVFLTGVDVANRASRGAIVAFGNSITDGYHSTPDSNRRWPDDLARRLLAARGRTPMAVVNAGISGNRVLNPGAGPSALARFGRDVLDQPGARCVIVLEGINDIGQANDSTNRDSFVSAADVIYGLGQLAQRAHERGLLIFGATLTPFEAPTPYSYYTPAAEAKRQAVNQWIRTSGVFDGVIDFDAATRDPSRPTRFLPAYDGDHLHPSDAGYAAMAQSIDLTQLARCSR